MEYTNSGEYRRIRGAASLMRCCSGWTCWKSHQVAVWQQMGQQGVGSHDLLPWIYRRQTSKTVQLEPEKAPGLQKSDICTARETPLQDPIRL